VTNCPHCEAPLADASANICPSCGESLGAPPRSKGLAVKKGGGAALTERVLFEGRPAAIAGIGEAVLAVVSLGIGWLWLWVKSLSSHYRITSSRIVIERGLFSKRMEQIDLYRVEDYVVELPLGQRMLGTGNLVVTTTDRTTKGEVRLDRLKTDVKQLYEELRQATEADKLRRGVRRVDPV
jgi:hypothetical protein